MGYPKIKNSFIKIAGIYLPILMADTSVLDRWLWLSKRLPRTANHERLLDIGCGAGAFTVGAAKKGYQSTGLTWSETEKKHAENLADICKSSAKFEICDVRDLDKKGSFKSAFDQVICCENIEHILNDQKLICDIYTCLKPRGQLLLTTPNYYYRSITDENGPFEPNENGGHVRRGYTRAMLVELLTKAGFLIEEVSFCSGFSSQKITWVYRKLMKIHPILAKMLILPFRWIPPLLDPVIAALKLWPSYSICIVGIKPR